jgi:hypothetical protein
MRLVFADQSSLNQQRAEPLVFPFSLLILLTSQLFFCMIVLS